MASKENNRKVPRFGSTPRKILRKFENNTTDLKPLFKDTQLIKGVIDNFKNKNSSLYETVEKWILRTKLASKEHNFTLTPFIAEYNDTSSCVHQLYDILHNSELEYIFVEPKWGQNNFFYHYFLYIPIPEDMLALDKKKLINEHWQLILDSTEGFKKNKTIKGFEPMYSVSRVYGWDGSWIVYSVSAVANNNFWSLPLTRTTYNGSQPFVAVKGGEFAIMQSDDNCESISLAKDAEKQIKELVNENKNVDFYKGEDIKVMPEWIVAHGINLDNIKNGNYVNYSKDFGGKLGPIAIESDIPNARKVLEFMKGDIMGDPTYRFKPEEITSCRLIR